MGILKVIIYMKVMIYMKSEPSVEKSSQKLSHASDSNYIII